MLMFVASVTSGLAAETGFKGRSITENVYMPTGFTLNQGEFKIGLGSVGYGISDRVQVGTNILLYLFQIYNANLKVEVLDSENLNVATGLTLNHFNPAVFDTEEGFSSFSPYVAVSPRLSERAVFHMTARYAYFSEEGDWDGDDITSIVNGTSFLVGLEYSLSNKTKFLSETGYDSTFNGLRLGGAVLFGWEKFRLKLGITYFKPDDTPGFTFPVIGLWWRFNG